MYNMPLYELYPSYKCTFPDSPQESFPCENTDFCGKPSVHAVIDWSNSTSLHNWVEQMDLTCTSKFEIGFLASCYFIGYMLGSVTLTRLADLYGRKSIFTFGCMLHTVCNAVLLYATNLYVVYALILLMGLVGPAREGVGFLYMFEFLSKRA